MKDYKKPEFHFIRNPDELSGNELQNCQMTSCPNISTVTVINGKIRNTGSSLATYSGKSLENM